MSFFTFDSPPQFHVAMTRVSPPPKPKRLYNTDG